MEDSRDRLEPRTKVSHRTVLKLLVLEVLSGVMAKSREQERKRIVWPRPLALNEVDGIVTKQKLSMPKCRDSMPISSQT